MVIWRTRLELKLNSGATSDELLPCVRSLMIAEFRLRLAITPLAQPLNGKSSRRATTP